MKEPPMPTQQPPTLSLIPSILLSLALSLLLSLSLTAPLSSAQSSPPPYDPVFNTYPRGKKLYEDSIKNKNPESTYELGTFYVNIKEYDKAIL
ncbi:MAG: hypothetical protein LBC09_01880, partial [Helicobacteraceae bacterium]|nr:hypothetical protein [Helicobacteraceae bacterium]